MDFARLCEALETARGTSSRNAKVAAIAEALRMAAESGALELRTAVRVALGDLSRLGVGWRALAGALAARLGETNDAGITEATRRLGDLGAAAEELIAKKEQAAEHAPLTLGDVASMVDGLRASTSRARRAALITAALTRSGALEAKFLIKALSGELRIGAAPGVLLLAIAKAFGSNEADVRRAHGLVADLAEVAVLAHEKRLAGANVEPGRPLAFMLATPIETVKSPVDYAMVVAEEKLDGVRAQVHVHDTRVTLFARGLERVTDTFPEVARAFAGFHRELVLDGEILGMADDGRPRPFQALQMRLGRKKPSDELLRVVPVTFVAFDVLVNGSEVLVDKPWVERRAALEAIAQELGRRAAFATKDVWQVADAEALDAAFDRARKNGNEGLVLKRKDAPYEAGKRGQAWLKVKKATATLDVVVTAAEQGHGGRAGVISDYTFAVWSAGQDQEERKLLDVGKAYSGLTDAEIEELSRHFIETTLEQRGGWRKVAPDVVLEVGFDGIQRSDRHPSGFSLRFPRILKIRTDKTIDEIDTLATVEALFQAQVASGHREEPVVPPASTKKATKTSAQLSLFGDDKKS
jgi:DNA ligase-1